MYSISLACHVYLTIFPISLLQFSIVDGPFLTCISTWYWWTLVSCRWFLQLICILEPSYSFLSLLGLTSMPHKSNSWSFICILLCCCFKTFVLMDFCLLKYQGQCLTFYCGSSLYWWRELHQLLVFSNCYYPLNTSCTKTHLN